MEKTCIGDVKVLTVFLSLNHYWETLVFGGRLDGKSAQYNSLAAAKLGHWSFVQCVRQPMLCAKPTREPITRPISLDLVE